MFDEFKNAFQRPNNAHVQLIMINVVVYLALTILFVFSKWFEVTQYFELVYKQFSIPSNFSEFLSRPWTFVTYFFNHSTNPMHILFNMLALYWFGKLFVEYLGSDKLIAVYVLGGISGAVLYLLAYNVIPNPPPFLARTTDMVGASGAIFAIMVATATLLPNYTFFLLFLGPIRIKYIVGFYILLSFIGTVDTNAGGNIAHLGGALMGFVYIKQMQAGVNWGGWITAVLNWFRNLFKASPKVKVSYRKTEPKKPGTNFNKATQEEIDVILDKISDRGYESLSKEEKEKLFNASKK